MKAVNFLAAIAIVMACSGMQSVYAGSGEKSGPAGPGVGAGKRTTASPPRVPSPHPNNPVATGGENTGSGVSGGTGLTGSELTGSELTGSELTGSELTGFGVGFDHPFFLPPTFPLIPPAISDVQRVRQQVPVIVERAPEPSKEATAAATDKAQSPISPVAAVNGSADPRVRTAQNQYDAALARVRTRLNQSETYRAARAEQTKAESSGATSASSDAGGAEAQIKIAEMESKAVAADSEANAARQKLDDAVLQQDRAERARAEPAASVDDAARDGN